MFLDFQLIDKKDTKSLSSLLDKIDAKLADLSNIESDSIRFGNSKKVNNKHFEDLVFYREVLIESFCSSSCVPYPSKKIVAKINSLIHKC